MATYDNLLTELQTWLQTQLGKLPQLYDEDAVDAIAANETKTERYWLWAPTALLPDGEDLNSRRHKLDFQLIGVWHTTQDLKQAGRAMKAIVQAAENIDRSPLPAAVDLALVTGPIRFEYRLGLTLATVPCRWQVRMEV
jgi:hypothetical protein